MYSILLYFYFLVLNTFCIQFNHTRLSRLQFNLNWRANRNCWGHFFMEIMLDTYIEYLIRRIACVFYSYFWFIFKDILALLSRNDSLRIIIAKTVQSLIKSVVLEVFSHIRKQKQMTVRRLLRLPQKDYLFGPSLQTSTLRKPISNFASY